MGAPYAQEPLVARAMESRESLIKLPVMQPEASQSCPAPSASPYGGKQEGWQEGEGILYTRAPRRGGKNERCGGSISNAPGAALDPECSVLLVALPAPLQASCVIPVLVG